VVVESLGAAVREGELALEPVISTSMMGEVGRCCMVVVPSVPSAEGVGGGGSCAVAGEVGRPSFSCGLAAVVLLVLVLVVADSPRRVFFWVGWPEPAPLFFEFLPMTGRRRGKEKSEMTRSPSSGAVKARVRRAAGKQSTHRRRDKGEQLREKGKQRKITLTQELAGRPLPTVLWRPCSGRSEKCRSQSYGSVS